MLARTLIGVGLVALATAAICAQPSSADVSSPVKLFESVCLRDQVQIPTARFQSVRFGKLPAGVRAVIGYSLPPPIVAGVARLTPIAGADLPNRLLLLLPQKDSYLLLPSPGNNGRMAEHCAVIWRGDHYADALAAANNAFEGQDMTKLLSRSKGVRGMNSVSVRSGGRIVGAAEFEGWTMVRVAPDGSPEEQATQ